MSAWWKRDMAVVCNLLSLASRSLPLSEQHGTTHAEQQGLALRPEWGAARGGHPGGRLGHWRAWLGLRLRWAGRAGWYLDSSDVARGKAFFSHDSGHFLKVHVTEQLVLQHSELAKSRKELIKYTGRLTSLLQALTRGVGLPAHIPEAGKDKLPVVCSPVVHHSSVVS